MTLSLLSVVRSFRAYTEGPVGGRKYGGVNQNGQDLGGDLPQSVGVHSKESEPDRYSVYVQQYVRPTDKER